MLVKDEIRSIRNLPPDGDLTHDATLRDILPFNGAYWVELTGMEAKIFHRRWAEMRYDLKGRSRPYA